MSLVLDKRTKRTSTDFTAQWRSNLSIAQLKLNKKKDIPSYRFCLVCNESIPTRNKSGRLVGKSQYDLSKFCSISCKGLFHKDNIKGGSNPNWKGGVSSENEIVRGSHKYKLWRESVFKRDNYTCQVCSKRGNGIEADHILQFAFYPELRFELSNGRTLCRRCHEQTPTYKNKHKTI